MEKRKVKRAKKSSLSDLQQKAEIHLKKLDAQEKFLRINDWERRRLINDASYAESSKLQSLVSLLWCHVIDEEKNLPGISEQQWRPTLSQEQRDVVINKILQIISKY